MVGFRFNNMVLTSTTIQGMKYGIIDLMIFDLLEVGSTAPILLATRALIGHFIK